VPGSIWPVSLAVSLAVAGLMMAASQLHGQQIESGLLDKKNQIKQLEFEKAQVQRRLRDFNLTETETLEEIEALSEQLREVKWRERHLTTRRNTQLRKSRRQAARLRALTGQIENNRSRVGRHLRRLYRLSKMGDSATLIALARYNDFFKDVRYLSVLMATDRREIEGYVKLNENLAQEQDQVQGTLARLAALEEQLKQEKVQLEQGQNRLSASLEEMGRNQKLYKKYLGELDALREGMETAIARIERNNRIKAIPSRVNDPEALRGALPPPAKGSLVAAFGQQDPRYNLKKFQRGIVIRVNEAAPVNAIAPGRIVHAGPFRGYQQLVVVDHGKGLFSVYGHLERLEVARGAAVQAGMRLGSATYQPVGKNYEVYFEIRWKGKAEDPVKWLKADSYTRKSANGSES
jgi:septal ring factor EnvC (AmiA/AmiB activator)